MASRFLEAGKVVSTHAVRGEVKVLPWSDSPHALCGLKELYLDNSGRQPLTVESARPHKNFALIKFRGYDDIDTSRKLIERVLWLDRRDITLEPGEHFIADLIGLTAIDADDDSVSYGAVIDITDNGAHDVYHIRLDNGKIGMVPAAGGIVAEINTDRGFISIRPVEGLFDYAY